MMGSIMYYLITSKTTNNKTNTLMKIAILALAAATLISSCTKQPIGILSIPIYEEDIKQIQEAKQK